MFLIESPGSSAAPSAFETSLSVVSVIASVASLALAVIAIWFASKFYELSSKQAKDAEKASTDIAKSVGKLELIFNKMYSDTFGMVQNMQERIWQLVPPSSAEGTGKNVHPASKSESDTDALDNSDPGAPPPPPASQETQNHVEDTIEDDKVVNQATKGIIQWVLFDVGRALTVPELATVIGVANETELLPAIVDLRKHGVVTWEGDLSSISSNDRISLTPRAAGEMFARRVSGSSGGNENIEIRGTDPSGRPLWV